MSYLESASPKTIGYKESAYPESDYSKPAGKEGTFTEQSPYVDKDGYDDYHVNHFIAYFKIEYSARHQISQEHFFQHFTEIFNKDLPEKDKGLFKNEFTAIKTKYKFNNNDTIMFLMKDDIYHKYLIHQDWVSIQKDAESKSFYARTLKREWNIEAIDNDLVNPLPNLVKLMAKALGTNTDKETILGILHQHFLAGRRSWAFGKEENLFYVETVAFERYSSVLYSTLEGVLGIRESILDVWIKLLMNFSAFYQVKFIPVYKKEQLLAGYTPFKKTNILYNQSRTKTSGEALSLPWFADIFKRHSGLKNI